MGLAFRCLSAWRRPVSMLWWLSCIGGTSGFIGGRFDLAVQRFVDAWMAFPGLLLLLTVMSIVGRGLPQMIVTLGIAGGIVGSRTVRGAVIVVKEHDYFQAAESIGSSKWRTFIQHVLPNIMPVAIIIFSINIGGIIISEASLSFLGFGLPAQIPSWGGLLSREGRRYMEVAPWLGLWARCCADDYRLQSQHVRRRGARPCSTRGCGVVAVISVLSSVAPPSARRASLDGPVAATGAKGYIGSHVVKNLVPSRLR